MVSTNFDFQRFTTNDLDAGNLPDSIQSRRIPGAFETFISQRSGTPKGFTRILEALHHHEGPLRVTNTLANVKGNVELEIPNNEGCSGLRSHLANFLNKFYGEDKPFEAEASDTMKIYFYALSGDILVEISRGDQKMKKVIGVVEREFADLRLIQYKPKLLLPDGRYPNSGSKRAITKTAAEQVARLLSSKLHLHPQKLFEILDPSDKFSADRLRERGDSDQRIDLIKAQSALAHTMLSASGAKVSAHEWN